MIHGRLIPLFIVNFYAQSLIAVRPPPTNLAHVATAATYSSWPILPFPKYQQRSFLVILDIDVLKPFPCHPFLLPTGLLAHPHLIVPQEEPDVGTDVKSKNSRAVVSRFYSSPYLNPLKYLNPICHLFPVVVLDLPEPCYHLDIFCLVLRTCVYYRINRISTCDRYIIISVTIGPYVIVSTSLRSHLWQPRLGKPKTEFTPVSGRYSSSSSYIS